MQPNISGVLIGTTDLNGIIGRRYSLRDLIRGKQARYSKTNDGTIVVYAGNEMYEIEAGNV